MDRIIIKQPRRDSPDEELIKRYFSEASNFRPYYSSINAPKYLFWKRAMHREAPKGYTKSDAWMTARIVRKISSIETPVKSVNGDPFTYVRLPDFDRILHSIDLQIGGKFLVTKTNAEERQKFLSRGILEEAIASSQLEGASTTRKHAKKMIAEQRKPKNTSEWMIFNNYRTLSMIEDDYKSRELSREVLLEMHGNLTRNTMEDEDDVGRFRIPGDDVHVIFNGKIAHTAPGSEFVTKELDRFIEYANNDEEFIHPIVKASILHFWMGYLHPFSDGNGRIARSIFYWYLLKHDYWGMAYIPVSLIIKRAKKQYTYAYIHSEQDNLDLTYFIDYSVRRVRTAIGEFDDYVASLEDENKHIEKKLKGVVHLNDRQKQLVYYLLSEDTNYSTEKSHKTMNGIARNTARNDIFGLFDAGLLERHKDGRTHRYYASKKLNTLAYK